jgi:hypothetical protein
VSSPIADWISAFTHLTVSGASILVHCADTGDAVKKTTAIKVKVTRIRVRPFIDPIFASIIALFLPLKVCEMN